MTVGTPERSATERAPSLWGRPWLIAVAAGLPVVALALSRAADVAAGPLAPHLTAVAPLGVLHDLRWLLAYHPNWWAFALEAAAMLVFRGGLMAALMRAAWPRDAEPPTWPHAVRSGIVFTAATAVLLAPFVGLVFGASAVPLGWLWLAGVGPAVVIALLVHRGAIAGDWWRLPTWRTVLWSALSVVVLSLGGGAIALAPTWLGYLAAAATGVFNAWAWVSLVRDSHLREGTRSVPPLAAGAAVAAIGLMVWGASAFLGHQTPIATGNAGARLEPGRQPVMVVRGYGSAWHGQPVNLLPPPFSEIPYSYRGLGPDGWPLPYTAEDTDDRLFALAALMDQQVRALADRTGEPVDIVADSEGSLITALYLVAADDPPVHRVVLTSPLFRPGRVYYPPRGETGWGVAASWPFRGDMLLVNALSGRNIEIYSPLARSIVENGPLLRPIYGCVDEVADTTLIAPLTAAAVAPVDLDAPAHWTAATHAQILGSATQRGPVFRALHGEELTTPLWNAAALAARAVTSPWRMPELNDTLPRPWTEAGGGGPSVDCDEVVRRLEQAIDLGG